MDIGNALRRTGREHITLKSILSNTISEIYAHDIQIRSVAIRGNSIIVKTGNTLVNSELDMMKGDIKKASFEKLSTLGITLDENTHFIFR